MTWSGWVKLWWYLIPHVYQFGMLCWRLCIHFLNLTNNWLSLSDCAGSEVGRAGSLIFLQQAGHAVGQGGVPWAPTPPVCLWGGAPVVGTSSSLSASPAGAGGPSALTTEVRTQTAWQWAPGFQGETGFVTGVQGSGDPVFTDRRLQPVETPDTRESLGSPWWPWALGQPGRRVSGGFLGRMQSWRVGRRLPLLPPDVPARLSPDWSPPVTRSALPLMAGLGSAVGLEQGAGENSPALTRSHSPDRALESRVGIVYITTK